MNKKTFIAVAGALILLSQTGSQAQSFVNYTGGVYTQDFDTLPYTLNGETNSANPNLIGGVEYAIPSGPGVSFDFAAPVDSTDSVATATLASGFGLSNSMAGWYAGSLYATRVGAQIGDQTTGGLISFGEDAGANQGNRALGIMATSTTSNMTFGVELINNTGLTISNINLSFTGELWRQTPVAQFIDYGYLVTNSSATLPLNTNLVTNLGSLTYAIGSKSAVDGSVSNQTSVSLSNISIADWQNGDALWLTWSTGATNFSGAQGIAIDNLSFSTVVVPEPSTIIMVGLGMAGMLAISRRRK